MSNHLVFNGLDDAARADLEQYWQRKKLPRLNRLLAPYPPDRRDLWLTVYRRQQDDLPSWYEARAVLHLPTGTLVAEADDKAPEPALDQVADTLAARIKRHTEQVRKDYVFKRQQRRRADLNAVAPSLQRDAEAGRREEFFRLLRPQLRFLRDHARRELRILELEGALHRREVTVADLLDEVAVRAWERFRQRPRHLPLDLWLIGLLHETLEQWLRQEPQPHVSLEEQPEKSLPADVFTPEEKKWWDEIGHDWWEEIDLFDDTTTAEDLLPDRQGTDLWDELTAESLRDRLLSLLAELPPARRQAFLLHALEDYDPAEIARLQGRPEGEVRSDIEEARRTLRERLRAGAATGKT